MTLRRWLPWIIALAVVAVTTVAVMATPDRHVCRDGDRAVPITGPVAGFLGMSDWYCEGAPHPPSPADRYLGQPYAADRYPGRTDHRAPLRVGIALGGVVLAVALGVAIHKVYPPAPDKGEAAR